MAMGDPPVDGVREAERGDDDDPGRMGGDAPRGRHRVHLQHPQGPRPRRARQLLRARAAHAVPVAGVGGRLRGDLVVDRGRGRRGQRRLSRVPRGDRVVTAADIGRAVGCGREPGTERHRRRRDGARVPGRRRERRDRGRQRDGHRRHGAGRPSGLRHRRRAGLRRPADGRLGRAGDGRLAARGDGRLPGRRPGGARPHPGRCDRGRRAWGARLQAAGAARCRRCSRGPA